MPPDQASTPDDLAEAAKAAVLAAKNALVALGKAELTDAVAGLESFAPAIARWTVERQTALAAGVAGEAKLDQLDRNFELLEADAILNLANAGILAQSEGERVVGTLLNILGKFALAAVATL
jgi:hypothetical protein